MEAAPVKAHKDRKRATNLSISAALLSTAKALEVNISRAAERGVANAVAEKQAEQWLHDNQAALESSNEFVEKHGAPLRRFRQF